MPDQILNQAPRAAKAVRLLARHAFALQQPSA